MSYFPKVQIPLNNTRTIKTIEGLSVSIGVTTSDPLVGIQRKSTVDEPQVTESSWVSQIVELDFASLTNILKDYERSFGFSTIEMFSRYMNGEFEDNTDVDDWVNTYVLYLGTNQIRQYSCP